MLIGFVLDVPTELTFTYREPEEGPAECRWIEPAAIDQLGMNPTFTDLIKRAANAPRHHGT